MPALQPKQWRNFGVIVSNFRIIFLFPDISL